LRKLTVVFASIGIAGAGLTPAMPAAALENSPFCNPSVTISGGTNANDPITWSVRTGLNERGAPCRGTYNVTEGASPGGERLIDDSGVASGTFDARCATTYAISATTATGNSASTSVTTPVWAVQAPGTPSATDVSYTSATVSWPWTGRGERCGADGVTADVMVDGGPATVSMNSQTTATLSGLQAGTTYSVRVILNSIIYPGGVSFTTTALSKPDAPRNLIASSLTTSSVVLDWDAPESDGGSDVTGYEVTGAGSTRKVTESRLSVNGLKANTEYTFVVKATNGLGAGAGTSVSVITQGGTPAPAPAPGPNPVQTKTTDPLVSPDPGNGNNSDGSHDADANPRTAHQKLAAGTRWPSATVVSGKRLALMPVAALKTNAGIRASLRVTKKSSAVKEAKIVRSAGKEFLQVTLKPGSKAGSVIVTAAAPARPGFEVLQSSKLYRVK
jgi:hypothetical protein